MHVQSLSFNERVESLKKAGFSVQPEGSGLVKISKHGCAAIIEDYGENHPKIGKVGVEVGNEIGLLVNGGYQMFLLTPSDRREPAQASQLRALHDFEEDLKEGLGLTSLYNESLGTTSDLHLYDRVEDRDQGAPHRPWEKQ